MKTCRATLPTGDVCGRPATRVAVFPDRDNPKGDRQPVCDGCALQLGDVARHYGTTLAVEKLDAR